MLFPSLCSYSSNGAPLYLYPFFFFQAEDGIRDLYVTGVQTCALPIWTRFHRPKEISPFPRRGRPMIVRFYRRHLRLPFLDRPRALPQSPTREHAPSVPQIGRASCRERV